MFLIPEKYFAMADNAILNGRKLDFCNEIVFCLFFVQDCDELRFLRNRFISSVLNCNVVSSEVCNEDLFVNFLEGRDFSLYILCVLDSGGKTCVNLRFGNFNKQNYLNLFLVLSKNFYSLIPDIELDSISCIHQIIVTDSDIFSDENIVHNRHFKRNGDSNFSDIFQVHYIELSKGGCLRNFRNVNSDLDVFTFFFRFFDDVNCEDFVLEWENNHFSNLFYDFLNFYNKLSLSRDEWAKFFLLSQAAKLHSFSGEKFHGIDEQAGFQKGFEEAAGIIAMKLIDQNFLSVEEISDFTNLSVKKVEELKSQICK